ncbi:MAG: sulfotransferase [Planctomycetota bacterium]
MADTAHSEGKAQTTGSKYPVWTPRIWTGINVTGWFRLLVRNRFAVSPSRVPMVLIVCGVSFFNSFLWLVQMLIYGRKIARTEIEHDPMFIIGHWRSGTTLLHELLVLDERHTYPSTYACFAPNHFLVSRFLIPWWLRFLMPARRPMDNMLVGWDYPQEDEFALCSMGIPSPYLQYAFPNHPPPYLEYLSLRGVPPEALARWKRALVWFLKCITLLTPKRIVLKSPPHTSRIEVLLELFPNARFVHIVRDPYVIFPSTVKTWKQFHRDHGAQVAKFEGLEEHVLSTFAHMYKVFEESRERIDPSRFCEVRYEELVADPVGQMRTIYQKLGLGEFDKVLPALEAYAARTAGYKTNRYEIPPETREEISNRWGAFIRKYGY